MLAQLKYSKIERNKSWYLDGENRGRWARYPALAAAVPKHQRKSEFVNQERLSCGRLGRDAFPGLIGSQRYLRPLACPLRKRA